MNTKLTIIFLAIFITVFFYGVSPTAYAAEVTFRVVPNTVINDTATIVEAYINPHGEELNAVEGVLRMDDTESVGISSVLVETGDSVFTLWPQAPSYTATDQAIRFTGGTPEGFTQEGLLFRLRIFAKETGIAKLSWIHGSAYRNDGLGTPLGISSRSLTFTLSHGEPNLINAASLDVEPPYFDTLLVSRDEDVYEGKYFVSFHASDDVSGVVRYTIVENQITTEVSEGVYVLQDQERKSRVVITAFDAAGNSTSVIVPTKYAFVSTIVLACVIILAVGLLFFYKVRQRAKKQIRTSV